MKKAAKVLAVLLAALLGAASLASLVAYAGFTVAGMALTGIAAVLLVVGAKQAKAECKP